MRKPCLVLAVVAGWLPVFAADGCPPIGPEAKLELASYVQGKFQLPSSLPLEVVEDSPIAGSCYRKLRFQSPDTTRPFMTTLYLTPDRRYLTKELMDTRLDPAVEEKRKQDEFEAGLHNPKAASLGAVTSPVTITVFSDFQCPYCRQTAEALEKEVLPAEKDVRLVFRHLPLPMHTWARPAAEAAACAHLQSDTAFWALHDFLFEHQTELRPETLEGRLLERAVQLENFDLRKYRECTSAHATAAEVDADIAFALANTIAATPTIFVNDHRLRGAGSAEQIRSIVHQIR